MISGPEFLMRYREDEVTRQQVRPGTARRVWPYLRRYRGQLVLLLGVTAVGSGIVVVSTLILRLIIDDGILRHQESVVVTLALAVAGLALVDAGAEWVKSWYSAWIGESLVLELRASVFRHVLRQPLAFFTRTQTGSLVSRMEDVNETQRAVGTLMSESVSVLLNLVLVLAAMFWLSWQLSLVALAVVPLFVLPGKVAGKRSERLIRQEMQVYGELSAMMAERSDVSGALLAMLYGRPEDDAGVFTRKVSRMRDLVVARVAGSELFFAFVTLLLALVTALVYGLGGTLVIHGVFQVGTLVAFIALVSQLYGPLNTVSRLPLEILTALVSFDRVFEILDLKPLITERPAVYPLTQTREAPGVEVAGVWFRYPDADQVSVASLESVAQRTPERPGDAWVLRDVTFQVPAGRLTALVGPSGAGKTTITHLVPRLYDPVRGAVRIGGHDVRDLTLESLRSVVGVVPQDAHLFHDTIRANLLYARPSATEKELTEACEAARIWELISSLPDGLDTVAGDRGYRFSGGEKQRVALARLLLKAPSVVVLDEATAHLDSESEVAIQRALATALAGRTSLVIAHRLSTVRAADQILVVDGGQIAERGTHDELLAAGGVYAGLYRTQFASQAALRSFLEEGNVSCANAGNVFTFGKHRRHGMKAAGLITERPYEDTLRRVTEPAPGNRRRTFRRGKDAL
jgi:ATP-binding cassette subfamily B protein